MRSSQLLNLTFRKLNTHISYSDARPKRSTLKADTDELDYTTRSDFILFVFKSKQNHQRKEILQHMQVK